MLSSSSFSRLAAVVYYNVVKSLPVFFKHYARSLAS